MKRPQPHLGNRLRLWWHCLIHRGEHRGVAQGNYNWKADQGGWIPGVVARRSNCLFCADCGYPDVELMRAVVAHRRNIGATT